MRLLAHYGLASWPFGDLEPNSYGLIMADPPWLFGNWSVLGEGKNATKHYRCMPMSWIMSLPILDLAAKDCILLLYATNPMIDQQIECLKGWGFSFSTMGTWGKLSKRSSLNEDGTFKEGTKLAFGTGYIFRGASEPLLVGTRGNPRIHASARNIRSLFLEPVREHSEKPEKGYEIAERIAPDVKRIEIFSRKNRDGWDTWGDQVGLLGPDGKRIAPKGMPITHAHVDEEVKNYQKMKQMQMFDEAAE